MRAQGRSGFTLVEVIVASAIFAVAMAAALNLLSISLRSTDTLDAYAEIEIEARNYMERMAKEIRQSGLTCPDWAIDPAGDSITFNKCLGSNGFITYWSPAITYSLTAYPGETLGDGVDNNTNEMTDEGMLTRTEAADVVPAFLNYAPGLPTGRFGGMILPGDLQFTLDGRRVTIDLTVSKFVAGWGMVASGLQQTSVGLRN